jgi:hypothetical protein
MCQLGSLCRAQTAAQLVRQPVPQSAQFTRWRNNGSYAKADSGSGIRVRGKRARRARSRSGPILEQRRVTRLASAPRASVARITIEKWSANNHPPTESIPSTLVAGNRSWQAGDTRRAVAAGRATERVFVESRRAFAAARRRAGVTQHLNATRSARIHDQHVLTH